MEKWHLNTVASPGVFRGGGGNVQNIKCGTEYSTEGFECSEYLFLGFYVITPCRLVGRYRYIAVIHRFHPTSK
jgi:hypothetical protein